jgi:hypothetical protein
MSQIEQVQTLRKIIDTRGISIGYQVMHNGAPHMIYNGSTALVPITQSKKPVLQGAQPANEEGIARVIDFDILLSADDADGECPYCCEYPNQKWNFFKTSVGSVQLIICDNCGNKFKQHHRQTLYPWNRK